MDSSLTGTQAQEAPVTETPASDVQQASPEAAPAGGQQPAQQPTAQEIADWTKDERYTRMWRKDPNQLYKSYKSADDLIEKQYKPLRAQAETFTKLFSDYGHEADPEKLKAAFEKLKSWEDPENPIVKRGNYISYFLDHPEYKNELTEVLEGYRRREIRKQFGEGVSDEIVNEIVENRKFREQAEAKEKKAAADAQHKQLVGTIEQGWTQVQDECKKMGFPVTDEIRNKLMDKCAEENVDPRFMFYKFQDMFRDEVEKHRRATIQSEIVKSRQRTHKSGVIPAGSHTAKAAQTDKKGMFERVADKLGLKT